VSGLKNKIIAVSVGIAVVLAFATAAHAQSSSEQSSPEQSSRSPDTRSPLIELEAVAEAQADNSQVFTAQVVDDRQLKDVLFYHRRAGQQAFTPKTMNPLGDSSYYTVSLSTEPEDLRSIEYYVQARDESGNRTVEGFAFDPYTRLLSANNAVISTTALPATPKTTSRSRSLRWWHIAAGILVAGAIASATSGDGGGGSDAGDSSTAPLTINLTGP